MKDITAIPNTFMSDFDYITTVISNDKDYYTFEAKTGWSPFGQSDEGSSWYSYTVTRHSLFKNRYMGSKSCTKQEFIDLFNLFTSYDFKVTDQWDSRFDWDLAEIEEYEQIFELNA